MNLSLSASQFLDWAMVFRESVDLIIGVLLPMFTFIGAVAMIGGPTVAAPVPDDVDVLGDTLRDRLRDWRRRVRPRGWLALTCILAVFLLGVVKAFLADKDLHQTVKQSEKLEQMAAQDRDQQRAPTSVGPILVTSVAESRYPDGRYFNFDAGELDRLLGRSDWDKHVYLVSKSGEKGFRRAVLRRTKDFGFGGARGRLLPTGKPGDWKDGQSFYIVPKDYGPWDPKEQ